MSEIKGRQSEGCIIRSVTSDEEVHLGNIIECQSIPDTRDKITTLEMARLYPYMNDIAYLIPVVDSRREILLLIGRDITQVHHVHDQRIGPLLTSPCA